MDDELCACGKRSKGQCGGDEVGVPVALVRFYYCVRLVPGEEAPLQIWLGWWCLESRVGSEQLTSDCVVPMIIEQTTAAESTAQRPAQVGHNGNSGGSAPGHVREAVAAYLTDCLDRAVGGARLDSQLWASSTTFVPGAAAEILDNTNKAINAEISTVISRTIAGMGEPPNLGTVVSGVGAELFLAPISKPLGEAETIIEFVGIALAVFTMQPALAVACAKAISHTEMTGVIERSIVEALSSSSDAADVDAASGEGQEVSSAAEAGSQNSDTDRLIRALALIGSLEPHATAESRNASTDELLGEAMKPGESRPSLLDAPEEPPAVGISEISAT